MNKIWDATKNGDLEWLKHHLKDQHLTATLARDDSDCCIFEYAILCQQPEVAEYLIDRYTQFYLPLLTPCMTVLINEFLATIGELLQYTVKRSSNMLTEKLMFVLEQLIQQVEGSITKTTKNKTSTNIWLRAVVSQKLSDALSIAIHSGTTETFIQLFAKRVSLNQVIKPDERAACTSMSVLYSALATITTSRTEQQSQQQFEMLKYLLESSEQQLTRHIPVIRSTVKCLNAHTHEITTQIDTELIAYLSAILNMHETVSETTFIQLHNYAKTYTAAEAPNVASSFFQRIQPIPSSILESLCASADGLEQIEAYLAKSLNKTTAILKL